MTALHRLLSLVVLITVAGASSLAAQDLAINNVRIIVGTGQVIEQGTIVIRGGRIVSAAAGNAAAPGVRALDGKGRSEEHTSELQSQSNLVCRLLLEKKNKKK